MKRPTTIPRPALSPILADAVYSKRVLCNALGWEHRTFRNAAKAGLRIIAFGKQRFILGRDVLDFFLRLAEQQSNGEGSGNGEAQ
jgi:hypothetical protein